MCRLVAHRSLGRISSAPLSRPLAPRLRSLLYLAAVVDVLVGALFLFAPEFGIPVWPTPVPALLARFIGAIVLANAFGLWVATRHGTWEGIRALFWVGLVYGAIALLALVYHLLVLGAPAVFWLYAAADAAYVLAIALILWAHEQRFAVTTGVPKV